MAKPKDKRITRLRIERRRKQRQARRAERRRGLHLVQAKRARRAGNATAARRHNDAAQAALAKQRELRADAKELLNEIRARRRSLKHRLGFNARKGTEWLDGKEVAAWIAPILRAARASGLWKGTVTSGFRSYAKQWWIYYVARIRPAARPGTSNHEGSDYPRGAVDVSDPWGLNRYLDSRGITKLKWYRDTLGAGDDWHFSGTGR